MRENVPKTPQRGAPSTAEAIRDIVIRIFEESRQSPGAPYQDDRFLAFLTAAAAGKGKRHVDSFNGCRRCWRFMKAVQLELGICFSNAEWDRGFSLSEFVTLVQAKRQDPARGSRLARKRLEEALIERKDRTILWSLAVAVPLAIPAAFVGSGGRIVLSAAWIVAVVGSHVYHSRQVTYARNLIQAIERAAG
jgi:hypothetical protein